jgi:hypothetical protein
VDQDLLDHGEGYALLQDERRCRVPGGMDMMMWEPCVFQDAGPLIPVAPWVDRAAVRLAIDEIVICPGVGGLLALLSCGS